MKQIFTLLTAFSVLFTLRAKAQFTENFDDVSKFTSSCWTFNEIWLTTYSLFRINGDGALITNPTTTSSETRDVITPYLNITSTSFTVSFLYRLNAGIVNNAERTIEVGLQDGSGYTQLDQITLTKNTPNAADTNGLVYNKTFTLTSTGLKRLVIKTGGDKLGIIRVILDDLYASASPRYVLNGGCNSAPIAIDDNFISSSKGDFTGNVILNSVGGSDNEPDYETFSAVTVVNQPSEGTVTMDNEGNFVFKPALGFDGGIVTFTYRLTDNGQLPLTSNIATVTIVYSSAAFTLPVRLISFEGRQVTKNAQLKWSVAENEECARFDILRSSDGNNFTKAGQVVASNQVGKDSYTFTDGTELGKNTYYKLKMVNKDNSVSYSNVIVLKQPTGSAANSLSITRNPVESTLTFSYSSDVTAQSNIVIYNTSGVAVFRTTISSQKGMNAVSLSLDGRLKPGSYILEVGTATERSVARLVKL